MVYDLISQHLRKHYKLGDIHKGFIRGLHIFKQNMNYHNTNIGVLHRLEIRNVFDQCKCCNQEYFHNIFVVESNE